MEPQKAKNEPQKVKNKSQNWVEHIKQNLFSYMERAIPPTTKIRHFGPRKKQKKNPQNQSQNWWDVRKQMLFSFKSRLTNNEGTNDNESNEILSGPKI